MRTLRFPLVVAASLAALVAVPAPNALANRTKPSRTPTDQVSAKDFDAKRFSAGSIDVDNPFLPLTPGMQFTLTGTTTGGNHEVVFTVTDVTKWVDHVRTVVIWDRDFQDGELAEEELAFMAQDDQGNVWSLGEYPEEHEDGEVSAPSTWLAGHNGATAGVLMQAHPRTNTPAYIQGRSPDIEFFDKAKVAQTNQKVCVPVDCYSGVLVVDEWDPTAQPEDGHQFKYHAPGVGVVKIVGKGGVEQETLVLTKLRKLNDDQMDAARDQVFQLDKRAYKLAKDVYAKTPFASLR
ncbi:MAG: hypothetical protein LC792_13620 [Actinobacteria bacterium]|nr:hypothetical protein [Actinomycetota bacterium]